MSSELPLQHVGDGQISDGSRSVCHLRGVVEAVDKDGVVVLRLGEGLLAVEVHGLRLSVGSAVELVGVAIDLWPVNL